MRTKYRTDHRFIALLIAVVMLLTSTRMLAFVIPVAVAEGDVLTIRDDAMHFIIRHWHTAEEDDNLLNQGDQGNGQGNYFILVEGYIMPDDTKGYVCYAKNQDTGELFEIDEVLESPYIEKFEGKTLTLTTKPLTDSESASNDPLERFAGISISAGHEAVTYDDNHIWITYDPYIHLVKGHVFYQHKSKIVTGTNDADAFAGTGLFDDDEIDTAWAYTYKKDNSQGEPEGKLIMSAKDSSKVCSNPEDLPVGCIDNEGNPLAAEVELTKYYSTAPGLHTDKTIVYNEDGRTFEYDLEAWYTEGYAPQVGIVLDASGSMAFALDKPSVINVNDLGLSEKLADKIGFVKEHNSFMEKGDLIGYYEVQSNGQNNTSATGTYRTWYLNSAKDPYTNYNTAADFTAGKKDNFAKTVKQPTQAELNNGSFSFRNSTAIWQPGDFKDIFGSDIGSGWGDIPASFGSSCGFYLTSTCKSGFLLDVKPSSSDNFTISFTLEQRNNDAFSNDVEILYIGPETVTDNSLNYFHVYRTGNNIVAKYGDTEVVTITNAFTGAVKHTISLTFDENGVTTYWDGNTYSSPVTIDNLIADVIVFAPFENSNEQKDYFAVDNVCLFDAVLDSDEVKELWQVAGGASTSVEAVQKKATAFLTEAELALILNTRKIDNSYLGFADYSYYIYNPQSGTEAYAPITYYTNTSADIKYYDTRNVNGKGWYYISCAGSIASSGTAKRLDGLPDGLDFYDTIEKVSTVSAGIGAAPDVEKIEGNTNLQYHQSGQSPIKFYIDSQGDLRCFFAASSNYAYTSFVYELADEEYIRTEGLQRVLGNFTTELNDRSPASQVSAVRFSYDLTSSTSVSNQLAQLIMLNWTSDPKEMSGIMSLNRGDGTAWGEDNGQYNYVLTGSTNTYVGLQAFWDKLAVNDYKRDDNDANNGAPRYLIVFTDGKDTETNHTKAYQYANTLKNDGYIIFTVLLGDRDSETDGILSTIAGKKGVSVGTNGEGSDKNKYYFYASNMDELSNAFLTDILSQIVDPLDGYTVTDYIDPRYDLRTPGGTIWHLHADGEVMKQPKGVSLEEAQENKENYFIVSKTEGAEFHLSGETDPDARKPMLYYDKDKDMYYLEWENQTIPTCGVGSDRLEVWIAQVWVIAKEDFIGGNDILVGGNEEKMNWVHHPQDADASSGTDDADRDFNDGDLYPSKGFPRVVANVQLLPINASPLNNVIYEGEYISNAQLLTSVEAKYVTDTYYLQYLRRYAYQRYLYVLESKEEAENQQPQNVAMIAAYEQQAEEIGEELNKPLIELLNDWLGIDNDDRDEKSFAIPYMYLPGVSHYDDGTIILDPETKRAQKMLSNGGGEDTHQKDVIGIMTYRWHQMEPELADGDKIKDYVKSDTEQNQYSITVEFTPLKKGDTLKDSYYLGPDGLRYCYDEEGEYWYLFGDENKTRLGEQPPTPNEDGEVEGYTYYPSLRSCIDVEGRDHIFAHYLPIEGIDGDKSDFTKVEDDFEGLGFDFDRAEAYINGMLIREDDYKWNPDFKPAREDDRNHANFLQPHFEANNPTKYGTSSTFINSNRTLMSMAAYIQEVVGGGFVLEMKMLIGELAEWLEADSFDSIADDYELKKSFTLTAKRSFTDTDFAEELKAAAKEDNNPYDDYGEYFTFTFTLDYTGEKLKQLEADDLGYVTIYAEAETVKCTFGGNMQEIDELPIGTYVFDLADANNNDALNGKLHFAEIAAEEDDTKFKNAYTYFNDAVLRGRSSTNEKSIPIKYKTEALSNDTVYVDGLTLLIKTTLPADMTLTGETTLPAGTRLVTGTMIGPNGTEELTYRELTEAEQMSAGGKLLAGTELPKGTVLPAGTELPKGTLLPVYTDIYNESLVEITSDNINDFRADALSAERTVTFYVGTDINDDENHRGKVAENTNDPERYTNDRLCIIRLSTGLSKLTIEEKGGQANESFLYRITGRSLGNILDEDDVDLIVTVHGGSSTDIAILPGSYTVTEIHDWSWRYNNLKTYGKYDEDDGALDEAWTLYPTDLTKASTSLRYKDDAEYTDSTTGKISHQTLEEHKTVIYEHERNDKVWLGGENYKDNHFGGVQ